VQLAVEHVCNCRKRMPVSGMNMGECPNDVRKVDTAGDPGVLIDVARIVVVDEIVPERLTKNGPRYDEETDAHANGHPRWVSPVESG
jgi:hypothetical protein